MKKIKIYTEEHLKIFYHLGKIDGFIGRQEDVNELIKNYPSIELPSDEEIDAHVEEDFLNSTGVHKYWEEAQLLMKAMCKAGAKWMRDKIQGGNNEQQ